MMTYRRCPFVCAVALLSASGAGCKSSPSHQSDAAADAAADAGPDAGSPDAGDDSTADDVSVADAVVDAAGSDAAATGDATGPDGETGDAGPTFALVVTVSPPGPDNADKTKWGGLLQFTVAGDGAAFVPATGVDATAMADPAGLAYRKESSEIFVGNRHGNNSADGVAGSISRFIYDHAARTFTAHGEITGNGLNGVHSMAFNPQTGELFAANFAGGVSRFTFDAQGAAVPNGTIADGTCRGVLVTPDGKKLFVTTAGTVIRTFDLTAGTEGAAVTVPGAPTLHYLALRDGLVYVGGLTDNNVHRLTLDATDNLVYKDAVTASQPVSIAFSPDGLEMFVGGHRTSNVIDRFRFDAATGTWSTPVTYNSGYSLGAVLVLE